MIPTKDFPHFAHLGLRDFIAVSLVYDLDSKEKELKTSLGFMARMLQKEIDFCTTHLESLFQDRKEEVKRFIMTDLANPLIQDALNAMVREQERNPLPGMGEAVPMREEVSMGESIPEVPEMFPDPKKSLEFQLNNFRELLSSTREQEKFSYDIVEESSD